MAKKSDKTLLWVLGGALLIGGGYYLYKKSTEKKTTTEQQKQGGAPSAGLTWTIPGVPSSILPQVPTTTETTDEALKAILEALSQPPPTTTTTTPPPTTTTTTPPPTTTTTTTPGGQGIHPPAATQAYTTWQQKQLARAQALEAAIQAASGGGRYPYTGLTVPTGVPYSQWIQQQLARAKAQEELIKSGKAPYPYGGTPPAKTAQVTMTPPPSQAVKTKNMSGVEMTRLPGVRGWI